MSVELYIKKDFSGYIIDGIEATNNGDLCNMMVTRDLLSNESVNSNSKKYVSVILGPIKEHGHSWPFLFVPPQKFYALNPTLKRFKKVLLFKQNIQIFGGTILLFLIRMEQCI